MVIALVLYLAADGAVLCHCENGWRSRGHSERRLLEIETTVVLHSDVGRLDLAE